MFRPTILVIIYWNFTVFQYRFDSPNIKRTLISSIANSVYELPHEVPNNKTQDLRKLGNIRKISNLGGHIAQCLVSLQEIRLWQQQLKYTQNLIPNFSFLVQFYWISPFCSKYFVRDYLSKQIFGPNLAQFPSNSFSVTSKHFFVLQ